MTNDEYNTASAQHGRWQIYGHEGIMAHRFIPSGTVVMPSKQVIACVDTEEEALLYLHENADQYYDQYVD